MNLSHAAIIKLRISPKELIIACVVSTPDDPFLSFLLGLSDPDSGAHRRLAADASLATCGGGTNQNSNSSTPDVVDWIPFPSTITPHQSQAAAA